MRASSDCGSPTTRSCRRSGSRPLRRELGDGFIAVEIDSSPGNPWNIPKRAHSVLTNDFVDDPGHPTRDALDQVIAFFSERLRAEPE